MLAQIATDEQRYADATRILQEIHDGLGGRPLPVVGLALVELAKVMWLQGKCTAAHKVLDYIVGSMGKTPAVKQAQELLGTETARCREGQPAKPMAPPAGPPASGGGSPSSGVPAANAAPASTTGTVQSAGQPAAAPAHAAPPAAPPRTPPRAAPRTPPRTR